MPNTYERKLKKKVSELICVKRESTTKTAEKFNIPLKTVEKWVTAFNKDNRCFDPDYISENK